MLDPRHIFISYSRLNSEIMRRVSESLKAHGLNIWTDETLTPGTPSWMEAIENAIEGAAGLVVILTPDSKKSPWVQKELIYADTHGVRIFPVLAIGDDRNAVPISLGNVQRVDLQPEREQDANEVYEAAIRDLISAIRDHLQIPGAERPRHLPDDWMVHLYDSFETDSNGWPVGWRADNYITQSQQIVGSQYRWKAEAHRFTIRWIQPRNYEDIFGDFYLQVEAEWIANTSSAACGVAFRMVDYDNLYLFLISDDSITAWCKCAKRWTKLLDAASETIRLGEVKELGVLAQGSRFELSVNHQKVGEFEDHNHEYGGVALAIRLEEDGDRALFEFDDFTVFAPPN
ncbi:MAG: toll/interleukin-1 receptor domain-containing protein [Chloroflexi bacterium]|nr:toll/interleukin-1 receptor domain-containing protein [Chloroflexota bacterium]